MMRIAIVYDCLYPYTVGGAERWYHELALRLAERHEVTYLTRRQWAGESPSEAPRGVRVVALGGTGGLYGRSGRRRVMPPMKFGAAVLAHLFASRRCYDVVHTCGFPYFPPLAAAIVHALGGPPVVTDWLEVWPRDYWREYLGGFGGRLGEGVQRLAVRTTEHALVASRLAAQRLAAYAYRCSVTRLGGLYAEADDDVLLPREDLVVFVGRHIPEKRVRMIATAVALVREQLPGLKAVIFGDGPERRGLLADVTRLRQAGSIECPGFVPWADVDRTLARALCLLLPSRREGYGLAVVEAAARGTPAVVTRDPESAAVELVENGVNGLVIDPSPEALAAAIVRIHADRKAMHRSTREWFAANRERLTIDGSVAIVERLYAAAMNGSGVFTGRSVDPVRHDA